METNHQPENPDKSIAASEDHDHNQGLTTSFRARSYECSFCKRGFSNAQALGGHMNIHRKQKAQLKQPSTAAETPPPKTVALDIPAAVSSLPPHRTSDSTPWFLHQDRQKNIPKEISEDNKFRQIEHLPLLAEKPLSLGSNNKRLSSNQSPDQALDLELRLGPDQPAGMGSSATRNFFE